MKKRVHFWQLMVGTGFVLLIIDQAESGLELLQALEREGYLA